MLNNEMIIELLKNANAGADLPSLLAQHGISTEALPPKRRRRLLNRLSWNAANFAVTLTRARFEIEGVRALLDDDELPSHEDLSWKNQ